jgi:predicted HicB family RNase H-like nuclease
MQKRKQVFDNDEVSLATRIPAELHRRVRLHCVAADILVTRFVSEALAEHLAAREAGKEGSHA